MSEFDWKKFGKNFPEVDKNLGGLPSWLQEMGKRLKSGEGGILDRLLGVAESPVNKWATRNIGNPVSAATTGAANMLLGGLPSAVAKKVAPQYAARQAATRAENPIATGVGQGAGLAGAVLAPTAAAGAGLQLGTAGARLAPTLARNALLSSAYAVPAAGAEALETGNVGKAALRGLAGVGLGTALGAAGEKLIGPALQRASANARLRSWGLRRGDVQKALRGGAKAAGVSGEGARGMAIKNAQALRDQLDDLVLKFGRGPKGAESFSRSVSAGYKNLGELYDRAGIRAADMLDDVLKNPNLAGLKTDYPQLAGQVDDEILAMASKIDRGTWRQAYGGWLKEAVQKGRAADDILAPAAVRGKVAEAFRDNLASAAETVREQAGIGPSLAELNRLVGPQHAVKGAVERAATSVGMGAREGSQTSPRLLSAIGPKQLGGAGIGMMGGAAIGEKPKRGADLGDWLKYGGRIVGSGLLGGALGRMGARAANAAAAPLLGGLQAAMPLLTGAGRAAGAMGVASPLVDSAPSTPLAKALTGEPETAQVEAAEEAAGPVEVQEAKQKTNAAFQDRIVGELEKAWVGIQAAGTRLTFDEFLGLVRQYTNDFDPKLAAPILFPDPKQREQYLKTYENALALQGMDVEAAFSPQKWLDTDKPEKRMARQTLQNWMAGLVAGPERMASRDIQDLVQQDIDAIARLRLPPEAKQEALRKVLQTNYGLNFDLLNQYGLGV